MDDLQIKKFSYNAKESEVKVEYSFFRQNGDEVKTTLTSCEKPLAELTLQMNVLTADVEKICSLPIGYCTFAEIRSVSFSNAKDIMGAVITCLVPVDTANSPVVINTPHLPSESYSEGSTGTPILPTDTTFKLKNLLRLIKEYIDGSREKKVDNQTKLEL